MNDRELKRHLQRLQTPTPTPEACERAWSATRQAWNGAPVPAAVVPFPARKVAAAAAALAAILTISVLMNIDPVESPTVAESGTPEVPAKPGPEELRLFREIERLFPGRLAGIVMENGTNQLQLEDLERPGRGEPVMVHLASTQKELRWISFSGQTLEIEISDRRLTFEVLLNGQDEVILVSDEFIWTPDKPFPIDGVAANATALKSS